MPPKAEITREQVQKAGAALIRREGYEALNARALAKELGCSTQPLFRLYEGMDALREGVKQELDRIYDDFMEARMSDENRLLTQAVAYVAFAREERQIFRALFLDRCMAGASLGDIAGAQWNQRSIRNVQQVTGLPLEGARRLFLNVWLFSHGMASQILSNEIDLPQERAVSLLEGAFTAFWQQEKEIMKGEEGQNGTQTGGDGRVF